MMQCPTLVENLDGSTGDLTDREASTDMSKKVNTRLRDIASLLPLAAGASPRNPAFAIFDMSVFERDQVFDV